ncbi:MAG: [LysW]-aminoadipate/[LysW]-glutamate kinase [Candidatus Methanodesulfokora sp.]
MIVVKVGGEVLARNIDGIVDSVGRRAGEGIVLVHGGGNIVTELCKKMGIEPKFVISPEGLRSRYTDSDEMEVYVMAMAGKINKRVVSSLLSRGVKSVGISGVDGPTAIAERKERIIIVDERGRKRAIDGGYTGRIVEVRTELIDLLLNSGFTVVMAPIAVDKSGNMLNVDADQMAFKLSSAMRADKLVMLTDVPGVLIENNVVRRIRTCEMDELIKKVGFGMNRKLMSAANAIEQGVKEVIISSGLVKDPLANALAGGGTIISS